MIYNILDLYTNSNNNFDCDGMMINNQQQQQKIENK